MKGLPNSLDYHLQIVEGYKSIGMDIQIPEEFLREGYDLQMSCLAARMSKWAAAPSSDADRTSVETQIDAIVTATGSALKEKLPGEPGARWVDREMESWRQGLKLSLDMPLQEFLDRPLPPAELEGVLSAIREKLQFRPAIFLTAEDLADTKALGGKGVRGMLLEAESAAYTACARGFKDLAELDRRSREWSAKLRARIQESLSARATGSLRADSPGGLPAAPGIASLPPPQIPLSPPPAAVVREIGQHRNSAGDAPIPRVIGVTGLLLAAVLVAILGWVILRRAGRSLPPS
jgi:hypothetical protein